MLNPIKLAIDTSLAIASALGARLRGHHRETVSAEPLSRERPVRVPRQLIWEGEALQLPDQGDGPLFHRRYRVDIERPRVSTRELMAFVKANVPYFAPAELAKFRKVKGEHRRMEVGDEYEIEIAGPWNGGVCVCAVDDESFSFVTLRGHPEAGQIRFRLRPHPRRKDVLRFEIMSWARSRDMLVGLSYKGIGIGKAVQTNAWVEFCRRVAAASGGRQLGKVSVLTEERPFEKEVVPHG